jgi:hypothetical protein
MPQNPFVTLSAVIARGFALFSKDFIEPKILARRTGPPKG